MVTRGRASQRDIVFPIQAHHQQPSPQNQLLLPETSPCRNYSPLPAQSSPALPHSSQSRPIARRGFSLEVPCIDRAATTQFFFSGVLHGISLLWAPCCSQGQFHWVRGLPGVQPHGQGGQQEQTPASPAQTRLAHKPTGDWKSRPEETSVNLRKTENRQPFTQYAMLCLNRGLLVFILFSYSTFQSILPGP